MTKLRQHFHRCAIIIGALLVALVTACASKSSVQDMGGFVHTPKEALALAKSTGKPIFVHVGADWCKPCRRLHNEIYPLAPVKAALEQYVLLELDMDKIEDDDRDILRAMKVQSIPMVAVFEGDLKSFKSEPMVARAESAWVLNYLKSAGYQP